MNPSSMLAHVLVDELVRCGVRHVVLCPGSRSAPLAYALLAAARAERLDLHVRVDERAGAFLALGLGKASGRPAVVVTTSGTAVANLHPAVLEAAEAGVPLLVLSADRPPELRGTRANQTTSHLSILAGAVRWSHDLGAPEAEPRMPAWRTAVDRAVAAATGALTGDPGPAHLNVPLRDPLAPGPGDDTELAEGLAGRPDGAPWTAVAADGHDGAATVLEVPGPDVDETLLVLGDAPASLAHAAVATAAACGWPVVAEPFGPGARPHVAPHGPSVLRTPGLLATHPPRRIVVVGHPTLTRELAALLRTSGAHVVAVTDRPIWPDPGHVAATVASPRFVTAPPAAAASGPFADAWAAAAARTARIAPTAIAATWPSGPAVADVVLAYVPAGATLFVGSSNAARDVDLARRADGPEVVGNRGLAGIDGNVSTAAGLALARPGTPTYALVGDLTFLHDANALLVGPDEPPVDLTVVVVDDSGGGIFGTLEYGEPGRLATDRSGYERLFGTPTGSRIELVAAAHRVEHRDVGTAAELAEAVATPPAGLRIVTVRVPREAHRAVRAAVDAAVAGAP